MHQLRFPKCATSRLPTIDERRCRFPPMRRILAIVGSAIFLVIAPGIVVGYIPWRICRWHVEAPLAGIFSFRILGVLLIAVGLPVLLDSFARFAVQGLGTPAPIFPTRHLVVSGLYRYVRNPMYVAVVTLILGQGLFFGDARVLEYGIAVWTAFHLFVLIYEEPTLRNTYGSEYEAFCANVHRWVPRLRPWRQSREDS
jgi:protein-S-isoprenylcysteine O-methyltransferase Ste14